MLLHPRRMPAHSLACQGRSFNYRGPKRREREGAIEKCERGRSIIQPGRETRNASETCHSLIHRVADWLAPSLGSRLEIRLLCRRSTAVAENNYAVENEGRWVGRSPSRSYWSGMRLLQFRQVKCHPLHPLEIPLVVISSSTISEPDSRNTREGRARVDPHFFSGGRGECQPASSAPSPAPISPAGISSRCASGFTLTSRGTLARSLSIGATVFFGKL